MGRCGLSGAEFRYRFGMARAFHVSLTAVTRGGLVGSSVLNNLPSSTPSTWSRNLSHRPIASWLLRNAGRPITSQRNMGARELKRVSGSFERSRAPADHDLFHLLSTWPINYANLAVALDDLDGPRLSASFLSLFHVSEDQGPLPASGRVIRQVQALQIVMRAAAMNDESVFGHCSGIRVPLGLVGRVHNLWFDKFTPPNIARVHTEPLANETLPERHPCPNDNVGNPTQSPSCA